MPASVAWQFDRTRRRRRQQQLRRQSFLSTGSGTWAYAACIAYYALCLGVTWRVYLRPSATTIGV